jgi:hypothetical protein
MSSLVRSENKKKYFFFEKRCSLPHTYNAGVVVVNSRVVGLAPGVVTIDRRIGARQSCQIFLGTTYQKGGKIYPITTNYTKCPQSMPNGCKIDQMSIK